MFENILIKLEDPKRPLLGPNVKALKFWGLWLPEKIVKLYAYLILHLIYAVFIATQYVDIYFVKYDMNSVMYNFKTTLMASTCLTKSASFLLCQRQWISVIDYVTGADAIQRNSDDVTKKNKINNYTKYCRSFSYLYWSFTLITASVVMLPTVFKFSLSATYRENVKNGEEEYIPIVSSWVPFDQNTIPAKDYGIMPKEIDTQLRSGYKIPGYLAASAYQIFAVVFGGGLITSFDTNIVVIMVFFNEELKLLRMDSSNIYGTENQPVTDDEAMERLKDVHKRHLELVKFARIFDSCLSPVMFFYVLVCSIMLCVTAYQFTTASSAVERILIAEYLVFSIAQLFMFCWHSNEVWYTSQDLMRGPYESTWWSTDAKKRKNLYILVAQFRKEIVFSAGPFVQLTVPTFISILKGAYSYYTLLSNSQIK